MWRCKQCTEAVSTRYLLLKHYKLKHGHFGRGHSYPCTYSDCPCSFKTWSALKTHLSRYHVNVSSEASTEVLTFTCVLCPGSVLSSSRDYFSHINNHLKNYETVTCMFQNCLFQSNIYTTFRSHKSRKHGTWTLKDFKAGVVKVAKTSDQLSEELEDQSFEELVTDLAEPGSSQGVVESDIGNENLQDTIIQKLSSVLLKLEIYSHVPSSAIDELLAELHFLFASAVLPISNSTAGDLFKKHDLHIDQSIINELSIAISTQNPLLKAIATDGQLATAYKRNQYYKEHFKVVEPVEYVLDGRSKKTFQYIPLLQSLQQLLSSKNVVEKIVDAHASCTVDPQQYLSVKDGAHFKNNSFFACEDLRIYISLYIDDFELCNPLGTSRKKHKLCAVYWILGNLPPGNSSALSSIYLALLCKSVHVKEFGYAKIFEPLLHELVILEQQGLFIPQLGKVVKGTVQCVIADNLGAHGLAGFVESFSGKYFCRFCTAQLGDIKKQEVKSGAFQLRSKESHQLHIRTAQEEKVNCFGVKRSCILTDSLSHFNVLSGYPPDIVHDLFEGIVPVELARCIAVLLSKKYFTLDHINNVIRLFPYKWGDKTNCPHVLPQTFQRKHTIGGNAHENWCLLRLLPLMVGALVPVDEPVWQVVLNLKDIVELVVAPVHSAESVGYLECKISEHRKLYLEVFPGQNLLPKHHFLEHYPEMIKCFGPLVALWTMRFEAKHSFFKQIVRHTKNFRNITLSLAKKHQLMVSYHMLTSDAEKSPLEVSKVSKVPIDVLNSDVLNTLTQKYPEITAVNLSHSVTINGITYKKGMIVVHGSCGGLPEFSEIIQLCILHDGLSLIVRKLCSWYREHYRAFELHPTSELGFLHVKELSDQYPLADYKTGSARMVTLKRFVHVTGNMKYKLFNDFSLIKGTPYNVFQVN